MIEFWESVLEPLFRVISPRVIVEVGSELGRTTRRLCEFCRDRGGVVHAIDPAPMFDVEAWSREFPSLLTVHSEPSLTALPTVGQADVVLLDGDHNWYTVFNELMIVSTIANKGSSSFPVVFLHDTGWPYGRRDLYYAPERIPIEFRHPHERKGIVPGNPGVQTTGGVNRFSWNACFEGGVRNGVLTAVEDFIVNSDANLNFRSLPGFHGLGIISPRDLAISNPAAEAALAEFDMPASIRVHLEKLEQDRLGKWVAKARSAQDSLRRRQSRSSPGD